jgi:hypothetical protein
MRKSQKLLMGELRKCAGSLAWRTATWWVEIMGEEKVVSKDVRSDTLVDIITKAVREERLDAATAGVLGDLFSVAIGINIDLPSFHDSEEEVNFPPGMFLMIDGGVSMTTGGYDCLNSFDYDDFESNGPNLMEKDGTSTQTENLGDGIRPASEEEIVEFLNLLDPDGNEEMLWAVIDLAGQE